MVLEARPSHMGNPRMQWIMPINIIQDSYACANLSSLTTHQGRCAPNHGARSGCPFKSDCIHTGGGTGKMWAKGKSLAIVRSGLCSHTPLIVLFGRQQTKRSQRLLRSQQEHRNETSKYNELLSSITPETSPRKGSRLCSPKRNRRHLVPSLINLGTMLQSKHQKPRSLRKFVSRAVSNLAR